MDGCLLAFPTRLAQGSTEPAAVSGGRLAADGKVIAPRLQDASVTPSETVLLLCPLTCDCFPYVVVNTVLLKAVIV